MYSFNALFNVDVDNTKTNLHRQQKNYIVDDNYENNINNSNNNANNNN